MAKVTVERSPVITPPPSKIVLELSPAEFKHLGSLLGRTPSGVHDQTYEEDANIHYNIWNEMRKKARESGLDWESGPALIISGGFNDFSRCNRIRL